jgi:hypothetical protein
MRVSLRASRAVQVEDLQHESHWIDQHVRKGGYADVVNLRGGRLDVDGAVFSNWLLNVRLELIWMGLQPC